MPRRACLISTCAGLAIDGTSRCPDHSKGWTKTPQMQARSKLYDSRAWQERRARQLAEFPDCAECGARAVIADHIHNVGAGGDFDGPLQSLCRSCHNRKTASEGGRAAKEKRDSFRS